MRSHTTPIDRHIVDRGPALLFLPRGPKSLAADTRFGKLAPGIWQKCGKPQVYHRFIQSKVVLQLKMTKNSAIHDVQYTGPSARLQYWLLMALFRVAINRYLYGVFARLLARFFSENNAVFLKPNGETWFKIYLNDGYWTRFRLYHKSYEPEVAAALLAAHGHCDTFCDIGSNKGYWSVFAANLFTKIISVEASRDTFRYLTENTETLRNVQRRWAAAYSESNRELPFVTVKNSHASAFLGTAKPGQTTEKVETVAVDDLLKPSQIALIKLDVEGAEVAAMRGAKRAIETGSVVIYEDHGNDPDCKPSAHLFEKNNVSVYFSQKTLTKMSDIDAIRSVKTDRYKGYNFIAGRSDSALLQEIIKSFANS